MIMNNLDKNSLAYKDAMAALKYKYPKEPKSKSIKSSSLNNFKDKKRAKSIYS